MAMADGGAVAVDGPVKHRGNGIRCRNGYSRLDLAPLGYQPLFASQSSTAEESSHRGVLFSSDVAHLTGVVQRRNWLCDPWVYLIYFYIGLFIELS